MERKYKDPGNKVYQIDEHFTHLLPPGCVEITDSEAIAICNPPPSLATSKADKITELEAAYQTAIQQDVSYMGTTFQADIDSQDILTKTLTTLNGAGAAPSGTYWKDKSNVRVPMTLAELNGLAMAMWVQGQTWFTHLSDKKDAVTAATDAATVNAVTW